MENTFRIWASIFQVLQTTIQQEPGVGQADSLFGPAHIRIGNDYENFKLFQIIGNPADFYMISLQCSRGS